MILRPADFEAIAATDLVFEFPSGTRFDVRVKLGRPYLVAEGEWACPVEVEGFLPRFVDARGVDSLQSLSLALYLVRAEVLGFVQMGGRVFNADGVEYPADALLVMFGQDDAMTRLLTPPRIAIDLSLNTLSSYKGRYRVAASVHPDGPAVVMDVSLREGALYLATTERGGVRLWPQSDVDFFVKGIDTRVTFTRDASGGVVGLILCQHGRARVARRMGRDLV